MFILDLLSPFVLKPKKEPSMTHEGFKRKLTAILSADVAGYSRLMDGRR
jgi:hypothetical protein